MEVIVNQNKFLMALRTVERLVSKNISLPILNTVLLKTDGSQIRLSATNLEVGINYWVGAKVNKTGEVAIPARIFSDFVSNVADEKLIITTNNNVVSINSDSYKAQILGVDPKDFPIIPKVKKDNSFQLPGGDFKTAIAGVIDSTALTETRPELNGICVNVFKNKAELAATDSFRLSEKSISVINENNKSFIIPRSTALEIMRILESSGGDVTVAVSDNQILISGDDFEIVSRLVDGRYPDYKKIIPNKFSSLARIDRKNLEKNVRMASVFSSSISDVKLSIGKGEMKILAKNSDRGEVNAKLACDLKNEPFEVSVNYHYLLDGLKIIPTDNVVIEFNGVNSPMVLKGENLKDQTYVIMPLRS